VRGITNKDPSPDRSLGNNGDALSHKGKGAAIGTAPVASEE
jgi:hypothetical protein